MNKNELLERIRADIRNNRLNLPTPPDVVLTIQRQLRSDETSLQNVIDAIVHDAALAAHVVQVANSALYRAPQPVTSLAGAVFRLGLQRIRVVVLSLVMRQMFQPRHQRLARRLNELWNHSVQVGAVSRFLASHFTDLDPDQAMLAGLVHDIGALPVLMEADRYPALAGREHLVEAWIDELHPEIGRLMLESWQFAPELVQVPAEHENLMRRHAGPPDYADVVLVANLQMRHGTDHRLGQVDAAAIPAYRCLGLPGDAAQAQRELDPEEIQHVEEALRDTR